MSDDLYHVREKLGALDAKVTAAHGRVDRLELLIREDLKDLKTEIHALSAYMNKGKGWSAAMLLLSGSAGALIIKLLAWLKGSS